jgi:SAM-dependent methyltransferase
VAISTLEFVSDIRKSCQEIHRILVPNGVLALVTPGYSAPVDFGLRVLTRTDPNAEYENRREALFAELLRHFSTARRIIFPRFAAGGFHIYLGLKLRNHIPASGAQNSL